MQGRIIKGISGFYYVRVEDDIIECKARGKFRHNELTPLVGDIVDITVKDNKGVVEKIHKRSSELIRPTVANVTQAFVIFALKNPDINVELLNKFLILSEFNGLKVFVCFNKTDLAERTNYKNLISMITDAGYEVIFLNAKEGSGIADIRNYLGGNVSVFCGPSGVGKSTILNKLAGRDIMQTGEISDKVKRGKHTTRHSELVEVDGGFIVDTPGFSSLEIDFITKEELQSCFPEFYSIDNSCKFTGCLHYKEPGCSVKEAVSQGEINKFRYEFYIKTLEEILTRRNNKW
ncbi:MAG: ribosome small subunit-dependent GTPase A [Bacillota bacterium]|nr:ribosome small subunit-dependent GTPase A [Bacillota bacterium]